MPPRLLPSAAAPTVLRIGRRTPASNPGWKNRRPRRPAPAASPAPDLVPALAAGLALALLTVLSPLPARAQTAVPICSADLVGVQACIAGTLCDCGYRQGGTLSGQPSGWGWDCGVLRPRCGGAGAGAPATINPFTGPWPNSVVIDRSTESTVITNDATAVQSNQQQTGDGTIQSGTAGGDQILRNSPVTGD